MLTGSKFCNIYMTFCFSEKKYLSHYTHFENWHKGNQSIVIFFYLGSYSDVFFSNTIYNPLHMFLDNTPKLETDFKGKF